MANKKKGATKAKKGKTGRYDTIRECVEAETKKGRTTQEIAKDYGLKPTSVAWYRSASKRKK